MTFSPRPTRRRQSISVPALLRRRRWTRAGVISLLLVILASILVDRVQSKEGDDWKRFDRKVVRVARVVDGDTVRIQPVDDAETVVRLVGVDAPELHLDFKAPPDYWADRAREYLTARVQDKDVILRLETTQTRDRYGRLLAYVYLSESANINFDLVRDGQAYADRRFAHSLRGQFEQAENAARKKGAGLWKEVTEQQMPPWRRRWLEEVRSNGALSETP